MAGLRVLDHVRQRLLRDPVERRLHLRGQAGLAEPRLEVDLDPRLLAERLDEPLDRRHEPEVVERLRPELDGQAAHVLERRHDELPQLAGRSREIVRVLRVLHAFQPEEDRRERLARLVVELPGEALALELLRADDPAQGIGGDALREVDRHGCTGGERLGQADVLVGEASVGALPVVRADDADRAVAEEHRDEETCAGAHLSPCILIHLDVVDQRVDTFAAASLQHPPGFRGGGVEPHAQKLAGALSVGGADDEPSVGGGQDDEDDAGHG